MQCLMQSVEGDAVRAPTGSSPMEEAEFNVEGGLEGVNRDYAKFTAVPYTSISAAPCMTVAEV